MPLGWAFAVLDAASMRSWQPRVPWPDDLVSPLHVGVDISPGAARGPRYRRVGKGLYLPTTTAMTGEQRVVVAARRLPRGAAVTGWAALRVAGAGFFDGSASDGRTELPVPVALKPHQRLQRDPSIRQIRGGLCVGETRVVADIPCTTPERAVLDDVRYCHDVRSAVTVMDMALVAGVTTLDRLECYQSGHGFRAGICRFREALPLATDRSLSPMETKMRLIWIMDAHLPPPLCNWPVLDAQGRLLGRPDLLSPELGVYGEFDGALHREREQHRIDVARAEAFRRVGLEGFAVVGADLHDRRLVVTRMQAAVARAHQAAAGTWRIAAAAPPV